MTPYFDYKKAVQAVNLLAQKEGGSIDKMKAIKLIYLADRYHLRKFGRPVLNDHYVAMKRGPVASMVKDIVEFSDFLPDEEGEYAKKYLDRKQYLINSVKGVDEDVFSESDLEALQFAYNQFGKYTPWELVRITHGFPEWSKFEQAFNSGSTAREEMNYEDFFLDSKSEYDQLFQLPEGDIKASKEIFDENKEIAGLWK